ncbi:MAG: cbb3-type cytochrome c oxidase subunit I [Porticoccaceae bacterium]
MIGTTLTFMAITYWLVPILFRRQLIWKKLASWQPWIFGLGMTGVALFLMGAGTLGVPRRHWDILFTSADGGYEFSAAALTMMSLNGMSVILAVVGGAAFCLIVVGSLLFGKKIGENEKVGDPMIVPPVSDEEYATNTSSWTIPGTLVLVAVFFVAFALYYFINWKYLSQTWGLS